MSLAHCSKLLSAYYPSKHRPDCCVHKAADYRPDGDERDISLQQDDEEERGQCNADADCIDERFRHQVDSTYINRLNPPCLGRLSFANLRMGAVLAARLVVRLGLKADYRRHFWRAAGHALRRGQIDAAMGMGFVAYHLIQFTREALRGEQNASFYSTHERRDQPPAIAA